MKLMQECPETVLWIKNIFRFWGNGVNSKLKHRKAPKVDFICKICWLFSESRGSVLHLGELAYYDWLSTVYLDGGMGKEGAVSAHFTYSLSWPRHKLLCVLCAVCCCLVVVGKLACLYDAVSYTRGLGLKLQPGSTKPGRLQRKVQTKSRHLVLQVGSWASGKQPHPRKNNLLPKQCKFTC